jgi:serine/threonine protein kinase
MIGNIVSNYRIDKLLGEGGMSNVYLGKHIKFEREVAIKILHASLSSKSKIKNRFKNEAYILSTLKHPNIVSLYDYIEVDNVAYLIMEYVEGTTLDEYVKNISGPIPEKKLINLFSQILSTVQFAHNKGIVHRDIKPSNFIITKNGTIKILDFGISKLLSSPDLNHTSAGAKLGTVPYMSPEQVRGEKVDQLSDIYSLGVLLIYLTTGQSAYQNLEIENKDFEIQNKIVHEPLPDPIKVYPGVTKHISKIIQKATQKDKQKRYSSCKVFLDALLELDNHNIPKESFKKQSPPFKQSYSNIREKDNKKEVKRKNEEWGYINVNCVVKSLFVR